VDLYVFQGEAGEAVSIAAAATSGFLCAKAALIDPSGNPLGFNSCNGVSPSIVLPASGTYGIAVSDQGGSETGSYRVNLQFTTGRCANTMLVCGEAAGGVVGVPVQVNAHKLTAAEGDIAVIAAASLPDSPGCPKVRLFDGAGSSRGESDCGDWLQTAPLQAGEYTVLVGERDLTSEATYNYDIGLQFIGGGPCATAIACGQQDIPPGYLATPAQIDAYTFEAMAGEHITFRAMKTSGNACIRASLHDPAANGVGGTFCSGSADLFGAPSSGRYTILVFDEGLRASGGYELSLSCSTPE
jgi:hypothetical protein